MQTIYFLKAHHVGNQYSPVLTQYQQVPTSTALYWPSIQWFDGLDYVNQIFSESLSHWQPVPPCFDPVSPSTDQYHPILTQYHQVTTSAALYRPSTIKYQSAPPNTDPESQSTNKFCPLPTQQQQSTNHYFILKYQQAYLCSSTWRRINANQGSCLIRAICHFFH